MRLLCRSLQERGHSVSTCYIGSMTDPWFKSYPRPVGTRLRGLWPRIWATESGWKSKLKTVLEESSPEVVLVQQTVIVPTIDACRSAGIPVIVLLQNVDPFCLGSFWSGTPWKCKYRCVGCKDAGPRTSQYPFFLSHIKKFRRSIRAADAVVSNSAFVKRTLLELFGIDSVVVTPLTESLGNGGSLKKDGKILLFSPVDYKGVDTALEVAGRMKDERFVFVGNTKQRTIDRIVKVGNVEYVPWAADTSEVYRSAKLLMVPSVIPEGYGMVCIEAMSRGIPCVVSGVGALPETIGRGGDAVSPHKDSSAWVSALSRYADEKYLLEKSRLALAEARGYSPKESVDNLESVVLKVATTRNSEKQVPG